ncbi:MAG: adenosylcobinamide-GDP ribazoletransferase [Oscillospiraceae bacterium]|jgi:adenosylcobinamide-GDP ribazoletransferase|nr:adenosylcobinamide-GDP ribazoletransferase [Oscillospiraceae bacterium]
MFLRVLRSVSLAFGMFSKLPAPKTAWTRDNMRYMMCCFPLVGAVIGLFTYAWISLCAALGFAATLRAAGLTALPVLVTGGIHLDGLCDVADALASNAGPEKRRAILKDPRAGAFAVVWCCVYIVTYFALCCELRLDSAGVLCLCAVFALSRALSGLCVVVLPGAPEGGLAASFASAARPRSSAAVLTAEAGICAAVMIAASPARAGAALLCAGLCVLLLNRVARRKFGAMSGDLAGWFLQLCELAALAALTLVSG